MRTETEKRLHDALTACKEFVELSSGKDFEWYRSERIGHLADERLLEIIGEALSVALRLTPELAERLPAARKAVGLRNRIIHGYDNLDDFIIWSVIRDNIPVLASELDTMLSEETLA